MKQLRLTGYCNIKECPDMLLCISDREICEHLQIIAEEVLGE